MTLIELIWHKALLLPNCVDMLILPSGDHWTPATAYCQPHMYLLVGVNVSYTKLKRARHTTLPR